MAAKTLITEIEYLGMTFDGREPDYVGGEMLERPAQNIQHSDVQAVLVALIHPWRRGGRLFEFPELRIRTAPGQYRVVDVAVYRDRKPIDPIPSETPFIAIEIVSPGDRHEELMIKLAEYRAMGVPNIWIADPGLRTLGRFEGRT